MLQILENLTEEQRKTLKQFRLCLEELLTPDDTDYVLVKFLRAKSFDLKAAVKIFKENYYNRITYGINTLLDTYKKPEVIEKYETAGVLGFAKDGTLIRYTAIGRLDFYGFIMSVSCKELCLYFSHMMESDKKMLRDRSVKTGKTIHEFLYIMDFEEFNIQQVLHQNVVEMGMDLLRLAQDCYPEIWSHILFVNAPKIFHTAFKLFKPVFRVTTLERIHIADKDSSKDLLLKYIDENVLPVFLGGKRVDSKGDPHCKEFITYGGKVPESFYGKSSAFPILPSDPSVKFLNIRPRSMGNISCVIKESNMKIRVQFKSENGSIAFSLLYRDFGSNPHDVELPEEDEYLDETADNFKYKQISVEVKAQSHCTQVDVVWNLQWPGIYVVRFNNSNSWFTSRKVWVKLDVLTPSKEVE